MSTRTELLYRELGKYLIDHFDLLHFDAETILQAKTIAALDEIQSIL